MDVKPIRKISQYNKSILFFVVFNIPDINDFNWKPKRCYFCNYYILPKNNLLYVFFIISLKFNYFKLNNFKK